MSPNSTKPKNIYEGIHNLESPQSNILGSPSSLLIIVLSTKNDVCLPDTRMWGSMCEHTKPVYLTCRNVSFSFHHVIFLSCYAPCWFSTLPVPYYSWQSFGSFISLHLFLSFPILACLLAPLAAHHYSCLGSYKMLMENKRQPHFCSLQSPSNRQTGCHPNVLISR